MTQKTIQISHFLPLTALFLLGVMLLLVPFSNAFLDKMNFKSDVGQYGKIELSELNGLSPVIDYELIDYGSSIINVWAYGTYNAHQETTLFEDMQFNSILGKITALKNYKIYTLEIEDYEYVNPIYNETCNLIKNQTSGEEENVCSNKKIGTETLTGTREYWREYNFGDLVIGEGKWKVEGQRNANQPIDFLFKNRGYTFTQWAWWNNSWNERQPINITTIDSPRDNVSVLLHVNYDAEMNSDFSDLRFTQNDVELGYWFNNNTYVSSSSVDVWVKLNENLNSSSNATIFMYYGNPIAITTSNISNAFLFGDDFCADIDWVNNWQSIDHSLYIVNTSSCELQMTLTGDTSKIMQTLSNYTNAIARYRTIGAGGASSSTRMEYQSVANFDGINLIRTSDEGIYVHIHAYVQQQSFSANVFWIIGEMNMTQSPLNSSDAWYYDNGTLIISAFGDSGVSQNLFGIWSYLDGGALVDWFYIKSFVAEEPSYTFGAEEEVNVGDVTAPYFTSIPANQIIVYNTDFSAQFVANDETALDSFSVNDTRFFQINKSGYLQNLSVIPVGLWTLIIGVNDTSNNTNYTSWQIDVTKAPSIINTYLNGSRSNFTMTTNATIDLASILVSGEIGGNLTLFIENIAIASSIIQDNLLISVYSNSTGILNVTSIYQGNANYSASSETWQLNITNLPVIIIPPIPIPMPSLTGNTIYEIIAGSGAGIGIFILFLAKALPPLLIGIAIVGIFILIGLAIVNVIKKFKTN